MIRFKIEVEKEKDNWALIAIEPLEQGYGHTLGNSLRRCMLNSLMGAAITSVKITGIPHQFSTINGVMEDVIEIILNLKKVRLRLYADEENPKNKFKLSLQKNGKGEVKASDIDTLGRGEIMNPTCHIATLTDSKAKLNMDLIAEIGSGYVPAEEKKTNEIGVIPIDALFSPILSVNYVVDQTRVGRKTDYERLVLDVTTDGTINPKEAVEKAAQMLSLYFKQIYEPTTEEDLTVEEQPSFISEDVLKASVEELDLPVRITNALKAIEIDTIGKLTETSPTQLMKAKNLGTKSLSLISEKLVERGLKLSEA